MAMIALLFFFLLRGDKALDDGTVIVVRTQASELVPVSGLPDMNSVRGMSDIVVLNSKNPSVSPRILSDKLYSANSPYLSTDKTSVIFAAKRTEYSNWQIFMIRTNGRGLKELSGPETNCFDPFFLPDQRIGYSCIWEHPSMGSGSTLYIQDPESGNTKPITFHPSADHSGSMLLDGRIIYTSRQVFPSETSPVVKAIRPDGTANMRFFTAAEDQRIHGGVRENGDGKILFLTSEVDQEGAKTVQSVSYSNPFEEPVTHYRTENGFIHSFHPGKESDLLISYREEDSETIGLYKLNLKDGSIDLYLNSPGYHYTDPVIAGAVQSVPKVLPSSLNPSMNYGIAVIVDPVTSYLSRNKGSNAEFRILVRSLAKADTLLTPASDGSLYIKLDTASPIQLSKIDSDGRITEGPTDWFWVMPGERSGFAGWNPRQYTAPANQVPLAINEPAAELFGTGRAEYVNHIGLLKTNYPGDEN
ncbi:MAG: hypothetical protein EA360_07460 [Balneolaceae bacterium]|nr:MAG: hypothetical protein EA360_07460 [Balneolaceae bacterium]